MKIFKNHGCKTCGQHTSNTRIYYLISVPQSAGPSHFRSAKCTTLSFPFRKVHDCLISVPQSARLSFRFRKVHDSLISVPQSAWLLSGDAIISNKTDPRNGSIKEKRSYGKIKNKTMLKVVPFIRVLDLKQQSSILRCFCRLKFEKKFLSNTFFSSIFRSKIIVHTAEAPHQIKYFALN